MGPETAGRTTYTDASLQGWGAIMGYNTARGEWPGATTTHINVLELEAVWLALHFASSLQGRQTLVMTDSMTTKAYINRQGGIKSEACRSWARCIWLWVASNAISIRALHVPGKNYDAETSYREGARTQTI